ncbi:XXYS1_4_G0038540.mRNA.1.CDS.1 [Saccharomyces cerevisiae]|nr:EM14S01-3B_G0035990.mRNA.1.CDS.1 [Saccharomyces cerevisiae]CAD6636762.1 XXYS1_4_G0038540.mRNA.1.CDS.1 [Saccharomyces cerevisiae]CAI4657999.1 AMH_1a_G0034290.mRNA.1.CDS.1 [Saccharomyces cerevisiae]CAI4662647.1 CEI_1a_G0034140.mRNA.1.CDS.1 [Saccharomyces cerevisiae]CAI6820150.1 AMH_1a_G0034290.mRNA.1.CDS.1 [Saccharomyces cerevisiae]
MRKPSISITTAKAIITPDYTLIKAHSKYQLPSCFRKLDADSPERTTVVKLFYRRFMRLKPFISNVKMVKDTYRDYVRYKFMKENYELKRYLVFNPDDLRSKIKLELLSNTKCHERILPVTEMQRTLEFVLKSCSYLPETKVQKWDIARDNTYCRQILKNLLTMQYEKYRSILHRGIGHDELDVKFSHLKTTSSPLTKLNKTEKKKIPLFKVFSDFDTTLIYLNETLGTRL